MSSDRTIPSGGVWAQSGPDNPSALLLAIETMLGYTGSVGTALWYEIGRDRGKMG
jgi:hypothetical protein